MSMNRKLAGVAGICAVALAATASPPVAVAAPSGADRPAQLLSGGSSVDARSAVPNGAVRSRSTTLDDAALDAARAGDRLGFALFDDAAVTAVVERRTSSGGVTAWAGRLEGEKGTFSAVEVGGFRHITVSSAEEGTYEVASNQDGDYVVTEAGPTVAEGKDVLAPRGGHADHADHADHGVSPRTTTGSAAAERADVARDAATTVDIAIVYPASLPAQLGEGPMQAQFAQGIAQANQAFATSGVATSLRLVGTRQVAQPQLSDIESVLLAMQDPDDGLYDEIAGFRDQVHADLVSMWLSGSDPAQSTCGIGFLGGSGDAARDAANAFTATYIDGCATSNLTFAHEVGHNLSAGHDAGASEAPQGKPYARGYVDVPGNTLTIMAYPTTCRSCVRTLNFSNPNLLVNGRPQGTTSPVTTFNAQAMNEQVPLAANYRQSQIYPGAVAIGGAARWKGKAKAVTGSWAPAVTFGYQWFLDGAPVSGATASTFKLGRKAIGKTLSLQVFGSAPNYATVIAGTAPVVVGKATFKTRKPKLRGVPRVGRVLSVKLKGWKPKPAKKSVKVRYQWMKNGKKIKGAKKATYRVRPKDRGKKITVVVKVKKKGYATAKRSSKKLKIRR
ncbi:hypothetical protein KDN32_00720 [Nocardioides sp. J2M5]|uniref:reprolysin-like metallopeptidase n=1 Tax=Nocardioides palaemonis TaxID=2829810 RepID=UPI001BAC0917|nr:M12 family metallo-peptidase [Nocardioides palaemonis]MBS2936261.1 hypothetical protein [Nocardioides palaemonis]